jgi:hypothetical protein
MNTVRPGRDSLGSLRRDSDDLPHLGYQHAEGSKLNCLEGDGFVSGVRLGVR